MRAALPSFILSAALAACGGATPELAFSSADSLAASFELYDGPRAGDVELQRIVKVIVDVAVKPGDATSRFEVQSVVTRFTASDAPVVLTLVTPAGARPAGVDARVGGAARKALGVEPASSDTVDPHQATWAVSFAALAPGEVLEAIVHFDVPGTITSDAQWLGGQGRDEVRPPGQPGFARPSGELLLRYDLPSSAVGAFQVVGADLKPVVTEQGGRKVVALFVKKAWTLPARAHARYTTPRASPKGYDQDYASSWAVATADYVRRLVERSAELDEGYDAPFKPAGADPVGAIFGWVRERKGRDEAVSWHAARGLKAPLEHNDLTTTDRVHLLHWLLREARVAHRFAMARPARFPHVTVGFPVPDAFAMPLVAVGDPPVWLDPSCRTCAPGEVRDALAGGQAILLPVPASGPELFTLPATKAAP